MNLKKKMNLFLLLFVFFIIVPTILILLYNFRNYSIDSAIEKSELVSNIVKDGLTAHMENGIMDKRDLFLSKITRIQEVKKLKILRSSSVDKQFGKALESYQHTDDLEREVLNNGKKRYKLIETAKEVRLKTVIPYIASSYDAPNCLKCHQAKEGEVLGAISMEFDITDVREKSLKTIGTILALIFFITLIGFFTVNYFLKQYIDFFDHLKIMLSKAYQGDYTVRSKDVKDMELKEVTNEIDTLFEKIESSLKSIQKSVGYFIKFKSTSSDPLIYIKDLVYELASIYKFKNIIEKDLDLKEIYARIVELIQNKYEIKNFILYEIDKKANKRSVIYQGVEEQICPKADKNITLCRADRIEQVIFSDKYLQVCEAAQTDKFYICLPLHVTNEFSLVLCFVAEDKESYKAIKDKVSSIENFFNVLKESVETHLLLRELRDMSLKDRMTGAYNRRYLDMFVKDAIPKALRAKISYAVLMIDIDHFKMVNDTYGHDAGDKVIKELVNTIYENIRSSDVVVRFGGEEFLVLLYNCDKEAAKGIAQKIKDSFASKRIDVGKEKITKTISIGIAEFPTDSKQFWQTIKFADMALYRAKESGRNRVVVYIPEEFQVNGNKY